MKFRLVTITLAVTLLLTTHIDSPNAQEPIQESKFIYVFGEVQRPGAYVIESGNPTLLTLIGLAGGLIFTAGPEVSVIQREPNRATRQMRSVNVNVLYKGTESSNIRLSVGDIVIVPRCTSRYPVPPSPRYEPLPKKPNETK